MADGPPVKFLAGILVATSTLLLQVPHLQDVIQVDAAHISFGKYTLFSAYATTANGIMALLGFAMLLGNEDKDNWMKCWHLMVSIHPTINNV